MKKFIKNYKQSIILILGIVIGGIIGLIFKEKAAILSPLGDLFLNLLLVIIIPLIFLTITTSIGKMKTPKRVGKILGTTLVIFIITSLISVCIGFIGTRVTKLIDSNNSNAIMETLELNDETIEEENVNYLERTINTISVNNFSKLLTNDNIIALIIFSILIGLSINLSKEKGKKFLETLESATSVIEYFIKIIMYYAPIGLGCYFATLIGTFGSSIAIGYMKTFVIYLITSIIVYIIIYPLYAFIAGKKEGLIRYIKNILPPTLTALGTCSSAASIPVNTEASKNIGVKEDISDTVIPLGTSFHKDGSIIGSVFKIMFLVYLFNSTISTGKIITIALIATLLVTAVPISGGTISEMLIITTLGFPVGALPILTIIATIIDAPATILNVIGDTASSMIVARIIDGKHWLTKKSD